jgi:hypothetical protein
MSIVTEFSLQSIIISEEKLQKFSEIKTGLDDADVLVQC